MTPKHTLTWGLAIATYNRRDQLLKSVAHALRQNLPPVEVVICDSSTDADKTEVSLRSLIDEVAPPVRLNFIRSTIAQQTHQRNRAAEAATADILFMIDDDTYLLPTASELVVSAYEQDDSIGAVGLGAMASWDDADFRNGQTIPTQISNRSIDGDSSLLHRIFFFRFSPYSEGKPTHTIHELNLPFKNTLFVKGCYITVRRSVVIEMPFDECLVINMFEDSEEIRCIAEKYAVINLEIPLAFHAEAKRPDGHARRGVLERFGWSLNLAYIHRKQFGSGLYVRLHSFFNLARFALQDFVLGMCRRDFSKLRGCWFAIGPLIRLALAPQKKIGELVVGETNRIKRRLR